MFSHVIVGANYLPIMIAFYDAVLSELGLARDSQRSLDHVAGIIWQRPGLRWPQFALRKPFNGEPATVGNGVQISFAAQSEEAVRTAWQLALFMEDRMRGRRDFDHITMTTSTRPNAEIRKGISSASCVRPV